MKKQTAVEWLIEQLDNNLDINHSWRTRQYIEQAKEMEKQQIVDAYKDGVKDTNSRCEYQNVENYYKDTFSN
jgi:hypothetical protein